MAATAQVFVIKRGTCIILKVKNLKGKSAIAVALQVCLGARASATGRGSQITKYVREGCEKHEYALIQVTLRNEGTDAYLPELYGNRITIERRINKEGGGGGYCIRNKAKVVQHILNFF